jgi:hypothetical protein
MTTRRKSASKPTDTKRPKNFDLDKAGAAVKRLIQENKEWVKEMAKK